MFTFDRNHCSSSPEYAQSAREEWEKSLALYEQAGERENAKVVTEWLAELDKGDRARSPHDLT